MKLPAFQFYPGDWRRDPGVQALDYETRGIWHEILCLMHESEQRGILLLNGKPMPDDALANLLHLDKQNLTTALTKLLTYGVASRREEDGALVNRRMVRDETIRKTRAAAGKMGGNPVLLKQKPTTGVKQKPTPSSSSSSSIVPPSPQGGNGSARNLPTSKTALRFCAIFHRKPSTPWSDKEIRALKRLGSIDGEELAAVESYYAGNWPPGSNDNILRRDLQTLLNNFRGEVDRAKNWLTTSLKGTPGTVGTPYL